jgi:hypothetical protein
LIFENVSELEIDLAPYLELTIEGISRGETLTPRNAQAIGKTVEWVWDLQTTGGMIRMRAAGYRHVRMAPRHVAGQCISSSDRGGISFFQGTNR